MKLHKKHPERSSFVVEPLEPSSETEFHRQQHGIHFRAQRAQQCECIMNLSTKEAVSFPNFHVASYTGMFVCAQGMRIGNIPDSARPVKSKVCTLNPSDFQ